MNDTLLASSAATTDPKRSVPAGPVSISTAVEADAARWDAFVATRPEAFGYHEWRWREVMAEAFGHHAVYLMAQRQSRLVGVLPLIEIRSRLFGRSLTSMPFLNYGGVLAEDADGARALVDAAIRVGRARRSRHVELRHLRRQFPDSPCREHKVTMLLPLAAGMWERFDRKVRNQVRKAEKSGLTAARGGAELLPEFYSVFSRNMRDLGTPVYARRFFDAILRAFPERARIVVVRLQGQAVSAGLSYRTASTVEVPWASSIRDFNSLCPNHLLYWHVIESAIAEGCTLLDFGRSTPHEGTFNFKAQWGAAPQPLYWEYVLADQPSLPDHSPKNPKFRLAIEAWKHCPLWLANAVGPVVVRSIP